MLHLCLKLSLLDPTPENTFRPGERNEVAVRPVSVWSFGSQFLRRWLRQRDVSRPQGQRISGNECHRYKKRPPPTRRARRPKGDPLCDRLPPHTANYDPERNPDNKPEQCCGRALRIEHCTDVPSRHAHGPQDGELMAPSACAAQKNRSKRSYRDESKECRQYLREGLHVAEIGQLIGEGRRGHPLGEASQSRFETRSRSLPIRPWRKADREHPLVTQRTTRRNRGYHRVELRGGQPETFVKLRRYRHLMEAQDVAAAEALATPDLVNGGVRWPEQEHSHSAGKLTFPNAGQVHRFVRHLCRHSAGPVLMSHLGD